MPARNPILAKDRVERGKDILASLGTEILIRPEGTAEIRGDLWKVLSLVSGQRESVLSWLGEEDFPVSSLLTIRVPV